MATYFYDKNGATAGFGTLTGNWTDASWSTSGAGTSGTLIAWPGAGNVASFGGTSNTATAGTITAAGTINLDGIITQNLTGDQTLNGGTLNFGTANGLINNAALNRLFVGSLFTGTNGFTFSGGYPLFTTSNGAWTGLSGNCTINPSIAAAASDSIILIRSTAASEQVFSSSLPTTVTFSGTGGGVRFQHMASNVTYNCGATFSGGPGHVQLQGDIAGTSNNVVNLTGSVAGLTGTDFTNPEVSGVTIYQSGTINLIDLPRQLGFFTPDATRVGTCSVGVTGATTSFPTTIMLEARSSVSPTFTLTSKATGSAFSINGGMFRSTGTSAGTVTFALGGDNTGANTLAGGTTATYPIALKKQGAGRWVLDSNNSGLSSVAVEGGTLRAINANALGGALTMSAGTAFELSGGISIPVGNALNIINSVRSLSGANSAAGAVTMTGATTIRCDADSLNLSNTGSWVVGSAMGLTVGQAGDTGSVTIAGVLPTNINALTKNSTGTLTLNGANSFSGSITHNAGVIEANTITASGNNSLGTGTTFTFGGAATLRYTGSTSATLSKATVAVPASGAVFENNGTGAWTVSSLTAANAGTVLGLAGSNEGYNKLSPAATPANLVGFTKTGAGRWISTLNVNPASGSTAVNAGTLVASNSNGTSKLFGYDVTVASGAMIQTGSDEVGQAGKCAYNNLTFNGVAGTPARIRIGGSVINPTIYMNGNLALPVSGTVTFNVTADVFKTPGIYTLVEFAGAFGVTGGTVAANAVAVAPTGRTGTLAYVPGTPNRITVTIA